MSFESRLDGLVLDRIALQQQLAKVQDGLDKVEDSINELHEGFNTTSRNYAERVVRGVGFLNENAQGWAKPDKLKLSDLDLSDTRRCVLGQLAARSALRSAGWDLAEARQGSDPGRVGDYDYSDATVAFSSKYPDFDAEDYGFEWDNEVHGEGLFSDSTAAYEILNHLWTKAIKLRRSKKKVTVDKLFKAVEI